MNEKHLKDAARELAATCELLVAELDDNPNVMFDYLTQRGLCDDHGGATPKEIEQLEHFHDELCKAWKQRELGGDIDESIRDAFRVVECNIHCTSALWHNQCPLVDEFWLNFTCHADLHEVYEYMDKSDGIVVSAIQDLLHYYEQEAESEYAAMEHKREFLRVVKKLLKNFREGYRAIRAKACVVKDENDRVGLWEEQP